MVGLGLDLGQALAVALVLLFLLVDDLPHQERSLFHVICNSKAHPALDLGQQGRVVLDPGLDLEVPEHILLLELVEKGLSLGVVLLHAALDDCLGVVLADDQLVSAVVADALLLGQQGLHLVAVPVDVAHVEARPALDAGAPGHQLLQEDVLPQGQVHHQVCGEHLVVGLHLPPRTGEPVQDRPPGGLWFLHLLLEDVHHDVVPHQAPPRHDLLDLLHQPRIKTCRGSTLQDLPDFVPSRNVTELQVLAQHLREGALAHPRCPEQEHQLLLSCRKPPPRKIHITIPLIQC
jgi:hypothetical protein